jgi:hypothetical protein
MPKGERFVAVDVEGALAATVAQGRARRRRSVAIAGICASLGLAGVVAVLVSQAGQSGDARVAAGPSVALPPDPEPGDPAVWVIDPENPPSASSSTITALVTRLGCHGGETGHVLRPGVDVRDDAVVLTFTVEATGDGFFTCPGNNQVSHLVDLGQELGNRSLIDGACVSSELAAGTERCSDEGVRWVPAATRRDLSVAPPTPQDEELIRTFLAFAADPGPESAALVGFADVVHLGLGNTLRVELDRAQLADARKWSIEVEADELFRAGGGPFSALDIASRSTGDVQVSLGPHPHCASPPMPAPVEVAALRRVSAQGTSDSCLSWWTVDLFVTPEGEVAAVTLDLWEP